jgi:sugar lactone lactonase YvrE
MDYEVAFRDAARVGEGPFWDAETSRLVWVDILAGKVHISDPASGSTSTVVLPQFVGAAVPANSGGLIAATGQGFAEIRPDGTWTSRLSVLPAGEMMNDAKCDAAGRLWVGSYAEGFAAGRGRLHVLSADWTCVEVLSGLTLPNGLGWSPDGRVFYLIDSIAHELYAFDVKPEGLVPASQRVLARFPDEGDALADGLTVDEEGCLWVTIFGGGRLLRLSPEGRTLAEIPTPVTQPVACAFGGPDLDVLYVTTGRERIDPPAESIDGSVLALRGLGVRGLAGRRFHG